MELWQQELLSKIDESNLKENEVKISNVFRKICKPIIGYKGCSFEDDSLTFNNNIYKLEVTSNAIVINYSKNGGNPIPYKFLLEDKGYFVQHNYYILDNYVKGSSGDRNVDYEYVLNALMDMIIRG